MDDAKNGYQATPNATLEQQVDTCPTCGSDCNERDELTKAEREITRLRAEVEALKAENERQFTALNDWLYANGPNGWIDLLRHELAAMTTEVDALRADAERWEHARSIACFTEDRDMGPGGWWTVAVHVKRRPAANTIDAAVDAARAAQGDKT